MAQSDKSTMKRLTKVENSVKNLEGAVVQITHVLIDQSERMDAGFRAVRAEIHELREDFHGLREDFHGLREDFHGLREDVRDLQGGFGAVTDRLDRLIEITLKERTGGAERLLELERRVAKLEQHAGL